MNTRSLFILVLALTLAGLLVVGCAKAPPPAPPAPPPTEEPPPPPPPPPPEVEEKAAFLRASQAEARDMAAQLSPAWQELSAWSDLAPALDKSIAYLADHKASDTALNRAGLHLTWGQLTATAREVRALLPELERSPGLLAERFAWFALRPDPLMTGYYGPEIEASLTPHPDYPYPLYGQPGDLETLDLGQFHPRWAGQSLLYRMENGRPVPYYDRRAIDERHALAGRQLELAWTKDPYDVENLQVQGSGVLRLPDGSRRYVLYDGKNGREFRSVPKYMLDHGLIERGKVNREGMAAALAKLGPKKRQEVLSINPSYVFFRLADQPPVGSIGRALTPMVSMATDPKLLPLGAVLPFSADMPTPDKGRAQRTGLGLAQDTGGVIKERRIDFYYGVGREKEQMAFRTKNAIAVYLLVSRKALGEAP